MFVQKKSLNSFKLIFTNVNIHTAEGWKSSCISVTLTPSSVQAPSMLSKVVSKDCSWSVSYFAIRTFDSLDLFKILLHRTSHLCVIPVMSHTWVTKAAKPVTTSCLCCLFQEHFLKNKCDDRYVLECMWPENQVFQSKISLNMIERSRAVFTGLLNMSEPPPFADYNECLCAFYKTEYLYFWLKKYLREM